MLSLLDDSAQKVIEYFITKALFAQPELTPEQSSRKVQVPKEHIEQWFTQAMNVKPMGAGSFPIDIHHEKNRWGADIKMLGVNTDASGNLTNSTSGEASLGQNFKDAGIDLDTLFARKQYDEIKNKWIKLYEDKYVPIMKSLDLECIYYFFILRSDVNFYVIGAKIDVADLNKISVNKERTTKTSVFLDNFIDPDYGNTKIYKSKKRLELRLRPKKWVESNHAVLFSTNYLPEQADLRKEVMDSNFIDNQFKKFREKLSIQIS